MSKENEKNKRTATASSIKSSGLLAVMKTLEAIANDIEGIAFSIPSPNPYTPNLVMESIKLKALKCFIESGI